MNAHERKSRILSREVIAECIAQAKNPHRMQHWRETLAQIDAELAQPDEPINYSGEYKTDKDAFLNS